MKLLSIIKKIIRTKVSIRWT